MIQPNETPDTTSEKQKDNEISANTAENRQSVLLPIVMIIGFISIWQIIDGIYNSKNIDPSGAFVFLSYPVFICLISYWLRLDSINYKITWVFDIGLFLYIALPIIFIYYLIKTRKFKGFVIIILFIGLFVSANILGRIIGALFFKGQIL